MKIVFMGTPDFAVPVLKSLAAVHDVVTVVTQPDRPKGRGYGVVFSPVKECAVELNIPVLQPKKLRFQKNTPETDKYDPENFIGTITALSADVFIVVAYGQILPQRILKIPPLGCINIHASLLPKYRGAAPMQHALLNGDKTTGVTIIYMDIGMDTGDIILKKEIEIKNYDRFTDLHNKMAILSCECILEALDLIKKGEAPRQAQNHSEATYAPMLAKSDGLIDWNKPACVIVNQVRALDFWPGTYSYHNKQLIKIWNAVLSDESLPGLSEEAKNGQVLASGEYLDIKTSDGVLRVTEMQRQNGKRMLTKEFLKGYTIKAGDILGDIK